MSTTAIGKLLTADEFAKLPDPSDDCKQELVRGIVVTMPIPTFLQGLVVGTVSFELQMYARRTKSGRVTISCGVVTEEDPDTVRAPDVAFWSFKRLPTDHEPFYYPRIAADLYVEVRSSNNTIEKITQKVREYFANGTDQVWVIDPEERTVTTYHEPGNGHVLWDDATLTAENVLPGFSCPVAELFPGCS